mgnify:FL=1|jgi:uncharacterized protein YoxC|tara:strand:+ start:607 stop:795 length:189 start_codon:yes stop_codon:yes gene_type:complete
MDGDTVYAELRSIKESLETALDQVNDLIDDVYANKCKLEKVRGNVVSLPESFSEDKERFIAP